MEILCCISSFANVRAVSGEERVYNTSGVIRDVEVRAASGEARLVVLFGE